MQSRPNGLFVAFFANTGERFGFYTMISIFVLFIQAKYGISAAAAGFMSSTILVVACILSATFVFSVMKRLKRDARD